MNAIVFESGIDGREMLNAVVDDDIASNLRRQERKWKFVASFPGRDKDPIRGPARNVSRQKPNFGRSRNQSSLHASIHSSRELQV